MLSARKPQTVMFVGIAIGFILGILVLSPPKKILNLPHPIRQSSCAHLPEKPAQLPADYESWLANQGIVRNPLNVDDFLYGPNKKRATLEAEFLRSKVHVTCVVFVEREKYAVAALHTWLKHCNDYMLYYSKRPHDLRSKEFAEELGVVTVQAKSSWNFLCKVVRNIWKAKGSKLQWLLFVSDDMFAVPENLRRMVAHVDSNDPYYLGHAQTLWGQPFNVGLAGFALSRGTVELLTTNFSSSEACLNGGKYWKKEDYYLGKNLEKLCVLPSDTRDEYGKGRFHGYNLNQLLFSNKLALIASYWKDSIYPSTEGKKCCSDLSVTFQGIEADKMYMYNYIINHLRIFTEGRYGNQRAPTPYPPDQVWKDFMKSRGYTSLENVSARQYIQAWKAKISEDLEKVGYKKKKSAWHGTEVKNGIGHGEAIPLPFQFDAVLDTE